MVTGLVGRSTRVLRFATYFLWSRPCSMGEVGEVGEVGDVCSVISG